MPEISRPLAIVGVSTLFPGSLDATGFWRDILAGNDLVGDIPPSHWLVEDYYDPDPSAPDKTYAKRGAFLGNVDFDALGFGVPPSILPATDTAQLLALIVAQRVLDDATQGRSAALDKERVSVILGVTSAQQLLASMVSRLQRPVWRKALREMGLPESEVEEACQRIADHYVPWQEATFPGLLGNVVAGRIANRLDLHGTNCVTDAACASAFSALSMAANELYLGDSDMVITGGVDTMNDIFMYMCFSKTPALSKSGDIRPFSDQADGTLLGEGMGMFAVKRLEDAEREDDRIYAVIRGIGSSSDGRSKSVYAPVSEGQARSIRRSHECAGIEASTVELVEAHGTGTTAGDAAEFEGLKLLFEASGREDRQWCALGTVKSQIGHTKAAAGAAGLFKAIMGLQHRVLPPTIKVERPNPSLALERSPFYLNTQARPWVRSSDHPRRAGVSSFGFGGSNFHVTVEEYRGPQRAGRRRGSAVALVLLGAASGSALAEAARALAEGPLPKGSLHAIARESQRRFDAAAEHRLALVVDDEAALVASLRDAAGRIATSPQGFELPTGVFYGNGAVAGEVGFLFPGQGSQYVGMSDALAMELDVAIDVWDAAADLEFGRTKLHEVVFPRPGFSAEEREAQEAELRRTEWAQPAIGAVSLSMLAVLRELELRPAVVAGHSFGEVTALHAAGALSAIDTLRVARRRGEAMAEVASIPGAMIAVQADIATCEALLPELGGVVVANHNHPTQVILSGALEAIEQAEQVLTRKGLPARRLPVATAFHSTIVSGAVTSLSSFLEGVEIQSPSVAVLANATAQAYPSDPAAVREQLGKQLALPVRFVDIIEAMYARGVRTFVEVGPSAVLAGLTDEILRDRPHLAIALDRKGRHGLLSLWTALGRLAVAGHALKLEALWEGFRVDDPRSEAKPKLAIPLNGANYEQPYPPKNGAAGLPAPNGPRPVPEPVRVVVATSAPQVTAAAPVAAPAVAPIAAPDEAWLATFERAQAQTAAAHTAYQASMAASHQAFLASMVTSIETLGALAGGPRIEPARVVAEAVVPIVQPPSQLVSMTPPPVEVIAPVVQLPAPVQAAVPVQPVVQARAAAPSLDLEALLLEVVAEKTGYPADMLSPSMSLEADLGVDSIKRVEILSAMRDRAPELPEVNAGEMAALQTLAQIVEYMQASAPTGSVGPAPAAMAPGIDLSALLLEVVAEKTGYPADMLSPTMSLEADLGVDSIKRVEILSAMRDRAPELPEVNAGEMAALQTLAQIVEYMQASTPASSVALASPAPVATTAPRIDLTALLLEVVAEKTGYPADMLSPTMSLEADLGVDSIKRVEILSAMRDRAPELPEVNAGEMAALQTLAQIVEYMQANGAAVPAVAAPVAPSLTVTPRNIQRFVVAAVPAPALGLGLRGLTAGEIQVTDDGRGVADALVERLRAEGLTATKVARVTGSPRGVIFLGALADHRDRSSALAVHREAFLAAKAHGGADGVLVTVQSTGGDFGLRGAGEAAWTAGLPALVKTAAQEWPGVGCKAIDLADASDPVLAARLIADELLAGGPELEVGVSAGGARLTLDTRHEEVAGSDPTVAAPSVIVASGGGRGVTAETLIALAARAGGSYVLLGRTPLVDEPGSCAGLRSDAELKQALVAEARSQGATINPQAIGQRVAGILAGRQVRDTLRRIHEAGGKARYVALDVTDAEALTQALALVRREWGPITGIVHGAGVLADRTIADKTVEQFDFVFDTKIRGLLALLEATADDPLALLVLFSSVAARSGNRGQCDYAMANEVLNKVGAAIAQERGIKVKSLGWGPWEGGMVTPELARHFESIGVPLVPLAVGAKMLVDEVQGGAPEVELVLGGKPTLGGSASPSATGLIHVGRQRYPFIDHHRVSGTAVVPVVVAAEWLARAARACCPGLHLAALRELTVVRGIRLERFDERGEWLIVEARQLKNGDGSLVALELKDAEQRVRYQATAELTRDPARAPAARISREGLERWGDRIIYDGTTLFHGPALQVIRSIEGISREGLVATLDGAPGRPWNEDAWLLDPGLFDGALQLALLWAEQAIGASVLPMKIGELQLFAGAAQSRPVTAAVRSTQVSRDKAVCEVSLVGEDQRLVAVLRGVETIRRPDVGAAPDRSAASSLASLRR